MRQACVNARSLARKQGKETFYKSEVSLPLNLSKRALSMKVDLGIWIHLGQWFQLASDSRSQHFLPSNRNDGQNITIIMTGREISCSAK